MTEVKNNRCKYIPIHPLQQESRHYRAYQVAHNIMNQDTVCFNMFFFSSCVNREGTFRIYLSALLYLKYLSIKTTY